MIDSTIKLTIVSTIPVVATLLMYLLGKTKKVSEMPKTVRAVICGIVFGAIAILGTEWGIPMNGAMVNCRDAAPLCAGLFFEGTAGIIAGLIGGIERWIAVAWGVGTYTRVACSISTAVAGIYAALLRKYLLDRRKPKPHIAMIAAFALEAFHLGMVFFTNLNDAEHAAQVVKVVAAPQMLANTLSVTAAGVLMAILTGTLHLKRKGKVRLTQLIIRGLSIMAVVCSALTIALMTQIQTSVAVGQIQTVMQQNISDIESEISEATNAKLLEAAHAIADKDDEEDLTELLKEYSVCEIDYVDENGIIVRSTDPTSIGFDVASGEQSAAFLCLLDDTDEYVQALGATTRDPSVNRKYVGVKQGSGFLQVAYDEAQLLKNMSQSLLTAAHNRHINKTGFLMVMNAKGYVCSMTADAIESVRFDMDVIDQHEPKEIFTCTMKAGKCVCMYEQLEGYTILAAVPETEVYSVRDASVLAFSFVAFIVFGMLFVQIYLALKSSVVDSVRSVNDTLSHIVDGDLDKTVEQRNCAEFSQLSDGINTTVDALKGYIEGAKAHIEQELQVARNIQLSALPRTFPAYPKRKDMDIYAFTQPAKEVGGDFYDYYFTNNGHFHILIADVSGKGIPAAMFMMRAKTQLKSLTEAGNKIDTVFKEGNEALCEGNDAEMFVTVWMADINMETGYTEFASAGHNQPCVRHKDGKFSIIKARPGLVMGGMEGIRYRKQQLQLEPGDQLVLYTDGVTEATNSRNELYGDDRMVNLLNAREYPNINSMCEALRRDVMDFTGEADQFDDITVLAFDYIGPEKAKEIHFDEASIDNIPIVTEFIESELEKLDCPMKTVVQINIAIDEIYSNIVKYAYPGEGKGPATVRIGTKEDPDSIVLTFIDEGIPYNPMKKEDPNTTLSAEEREIGGLGIFMVKKSMDDMTYEYADNKNILHIIKKI